MTVSWWTEVSGPTIAQGDLLRDCLLPLFVHEPIPSKEPMQQTVKLAQLMVMTQSCDLENQKIEFVALCPINSLTEFEAANPKFAKKGAWENVRKGRIEGLHLLASPDQPDDNRS